MQISLTPDIERFVREQLASGAYATAEDVLQAAMAALRQARKFGDFAPGELDALLEEGERSLDQAGPISAKEVFSELRRRGEDHRNG